jgi:hypothetical protein
MAPPKQIAYSLAAVIEERSDNALVAVPCKGGNELAIWDGVTTHRVNSEQLSSPEAIRSHIAYWLAVQEVPKGEMSRLTADHEL